MAIYMTHHAYITLFLAQCLFQIFEEDSLNTWDDLHQDRQGFRNRGLTAFSWRSHIKHYVAHLKYMKMQVKIERKPNITTMPRLIYS